MFTFDNVKSKILVKEENGLAQKVMGIFFYGFKNEEELNAYKELLKHKKCRECFAQYETLNDYKFLFYNKGRQGYLTEKGILVEDQKKHTKKKKGEKL